MSRFSNLSQSSRRWLLLALGVLVLGVVLWSMQEDRQKPDPLVTTPALALESLQRGTLYFNSVARSWLIAKRPDLLTPEDLDENSDRMRALTQAVQLPK